MEIGESWKSIFVNWPTKMPRRGVLVTNFDEQISFNDFLIHETMVLVERQAPDTMGARQVLIPFSNILGVKITDVVQKETLRSFGFEAAARPAAAVTR